MKLETMLKLFDAFDSLESELLEVSTGRKAAGLADYQRELARIARDAGYSESFAIAWTQMREAMAELRRADVAIDGPRKKTS